MPPNPLSLKQRLAALSIAPSSPSSPHGAEPQPAARRKSILQPWVKRNGSENGAPSERDKAQDVMSRMIWQAGVDYETKPLVVLNGSALPDPREVNYDILLSCILSYLNLYVEADYTVVFFAAGGRHAPSWNWVWKAYRSLSRKYRKNLKKLFIVHSSFFSKMLFSLAGAVISPKFFRKITYIGTLSELAQHVPLTQIDVPPPVYQENLKHEKQIILPVPSRSNIFGVPLEELMGYDGEKGGIPRVLKDCIQFLRETGMEDQGLFRRSPSSILLRQVKEAYDRGQVVSLDAFGDPHLAAVLIKKYLRDLPEPIVPESLYHVIRRCPPPSDDISSITYIRDTFLPELPPCAYIVLSHVLHLMHDVSLRAVSNKMDAHNLAVVLCPNLLAGSNPARDVIMCGVPGGPSMSGPSTIMPNPTSMEGKTTMGMVVKLCIQRYYEVFDETRDRSEAIPPPPPHTTKAPSSETSTTSGSHDDDEDIDDAMLVMPIGPSGSSASVPNGERSTSAVPPSAWGSASGAFPYKARSRNGPGGVQSTYAASNSSNGLAYASQSRAKSLISIEKLNGAVTGTTSRRGSISVGRGTTKKSSGAGVEAISITASGFFSPPSGAPPVPSIHK